MKSKLKLWGIIIFLGILYSGCNGLEARKDTDVHIYCQQEKYTTTLKMYINDTFRGQIPFSPKKYTCNDNVPASSTLNINLMPGTYNLEVRNQEDVVVSKGILILTEDNMELSGRSGGMDARQSENCLYLEIL